MSPTLSPLYRKALNTLNSKTTSSNGIQLYESLRPKYLHFSVPEDHGLEIKIEEKLEKLRGKKVKRLNYD